MFNSFKTKLNELNSNSNLYRNNYNKKQSQSYSSRHFQQVVQMLDQCRHIKKVQWIELTYFILNQLFQKINQININQNYDQFNNKCKTDFSDNLSEKTDLTQRDINHSEKNMFQKMTKRKHSNQIEDSASVKSTTNSLINSQEKSLQLRQTENTIISSQSIPSSQMQQSFSLQSQKNRQKQQLRNDKIGQKFKNYINKLSTGNIQSANNELIKQTKQKFQTQINNLNLLCQQSIKKTISYFNHKYFVQKPYDQNNNLLNLMDCINQVIKTQQEQDLNNSKQQVLQQQLKKAQILFNKKSIEHSLERMKFQKIQQKLKGYQQLQKQNHQLKDKIKQLNDSVNKSFSLKIKQGQRIKHDKNSIRNNILLSNDECRQCQNHIEQINLRKQTVKTLQQKVKSMSLLNQNHKRQLETINNENIQLKKQSINRKTQNQTDQQEKQINKLKSQRIQLQAQKTKLQNQMKKMEQRNHQLERQNAQKCKQISILKQQLLWVKQKHQFKQKQENNAQKQQQQENLQNLQNNKKKIVQTITRLTKLNQYLQTSQILTTCNINEFNTMILAKVQPLFSPPKQVQMPKLSRFKSKQNQLLRQQQRQQQLKYLPTVIKRKTFLIHEIQSYINKISSKYLTLKGFKLLYKFNNSLKTNFHQYIDKKSNILLILKLQSGSIIGGYSNKPLKFNSISQQGFLFSLSLEQTYQLKQQEECYCMAYDHYYLNFGNSQIRIRIGENFMYSNFGVGSGHFNANNTKFTEFLGSSGQREIRFTDFQVYEVVFDEYQ